MQKKGVNVLISRFIDEKKSTHAGNMSISKSITEAVKAIGLSKGQMLVKSRFRRLWANIDGARISGGIAKVERSTINALDEVSILLLVTFTIPPQISETRGGESITIGG